MRYEVNNVNEAVALAEKMKREGTHEWFRGQTQIWPLLSSFLRHPESEYETLLQRMARFHEWVKITPGLEDLAPNTDAVIAVAQHYGLPTNFIDFTTEPRVAGFFASHGTPPAADGLSCIMCLNKADLMDVWKLVAERLSPDSQSIEFITLDVPNLWRLEAQYGVFFYLPGIDFERHVYDLDRIVFPYTGPIDSVSEEEIYPTRKSPLEILLDQYFLKERIDRGEKYIWEQIAANNIPMNTVNFSEDEEPSHIKNIPIHDSWLTASAQAFNVLPVENFHQTKSDLEWELEIDLRQEAHALAKAVADSIESHLDDDTSLRQKLIVWKVNDISQQLDVDAQTAIQSTLVRAWDGLRNLPYTHEEIAVSLGNCLALFILNVRSRNIEAAFNQYFGETREFEFGAVDGSYARGYATDADILAAVRKDFVNFIESEQHELIADVEWLLVSYNVPQRVFEFEPFRRLFVTRIIPTQIFVAHESCPDFFTTTFDSLWYPIGAGRPRAARYTERSRYKLIGYTS